MRLLLNTHTFLWFIAGDTKLSATARSLIEDVANERILSVASLWEMAIKVSLGKLQLSLPLDTYAPYYMTANAIATLDIAPAHVFAVAQLPFHHRDPFDRLLIAQAVVEG